ncbi:MAG: nuclear transport factor 2 family protein [Burkholderiales bacterium]|nr:MAG: nuclear transport factor 2 family protein [Burkholderiales bacterium]
MTRRFLHPAALAGLTVLLLSSLGGCTTSRTVVVSAPRPCEQAGADCMADLMQALQSWQAAYNERDPAKLRLLYAPGALITDDDYSAVPLGGSAVPEFFDEMARRPAARMRWLIGNLTLFGETAVRSGECEFDDQIDGQLVTRPVRYSLAYQRIDGRWLIVLQHLTARP